MQKRIKKLAQGVFDYEIPDILFHTPKIELEIQASKIYTGIFRFESKNDVIMQGNVYTSHERMQCLTPSFESSVVEVSYQFDSEGMLEKDIVKGEFYIVLNDGEYALPFVVSIQKPELKIGDKVITSLEEFNNVAQMDLNLAFRFFQMDAFVDLVYENRKALLLYRALSVTPLHLQKMEEFLVTLNQKHRIEFSLEKQYYIYENVFEVLEDTILLKKNHWGYFVLECSCDSDIITLPKKYLTPDDFVGSTSFLTFQINHAKLHAGKNYVKVIFSNAYQVLEAEICVYNHNDMELISKRRKEEKNKRIELEKEYIAYRLQKKTSALWARDSVLILNQLIECDTKENTWYLLIKAWVLVINKQKQEAEWILDDLRHYVFKDKASTEYGFYLYIQTFLVQESSYMQKAIEEIEQISIASDNLLLFLTLLFMKEEYVKNDFVKYKALKAYIRGGVHSGLLYAELLALLIKNPYLLERMDEVEQRVLYWGAKQNAITKELAIQSLILIQSIKGFHKRIYVYLCEVYEMYPQELVVQTICKMLIKSQYYAPKYLKWYKNGIDLNLNIIGLNEAFIMSLDKRSVADVPREIELFYQLDRSIPDVQKSVFFVNMIAKKQKDPELFAKYRPMMVEFCLEQIRQEHIDDNLSIIYEEILDQDRMNAEVLHHLSQLLFIHKITVFSKDLIRISVASLQINQVLVEGLVDCSAYLPLYAKDSMISVEDKNGFWYSNLNIQIQPMFQVDKFVRKCIELGGAQSEFWFIDRYVFFASEILKRDLLGMHNRIILFLQNKKISNGYKYKLYKDFLDFYERHHVELKQERKIFLQEIYQNVESSELRNLVFHGLMEEDLLEQAYTFIENYQWQFASRAQMFKIWNYKIQTATREEKKRMSFEAMNLLKEDKTSKELLHNLIEFYEGSLQNLCLIWKYTNQYEIDCVFFEEKIIRQYLYTGDFNVCVFEVFYSYLQHGKEKELIVAFYNYISELYFLKEIQMDEPIFDNMKVLLEQENTLADVCGLAFLKYASTDYSLQKNSESVIEILLEDFMRRDMIFAFYKNFEKKFLVKFNLYDRTIIEYKTDKKTSVSIHFSLNKTSNKYYTQQMKKVYKNIYVWETILFFGDFIDYYIEEENGTIRQITESKKIENNDILSEERKGRYDLINAMLLERTLDNHPLLERYVALFEEYETLNEDEFVIL